MKFLLILLIFISLSSCSKKQEIQMNESNIYDSKIISGQTSVNNGSTTIAPTIKIQANASDNIGVTKVEFFVNNQIVCSILTAPFECNWTPSLPLAPSYSLTTKAYDQKGNVGNSSTVTIQGQN